MQIASHSVLLFRDALHVRASAAGIPASTCVLIGHEDAGSDRTDLPADDWRGLSALGHRRAHSLVERLHGVPIDQVLSSPALRCRQTLVPLAEHRGLDIEPVLALAAGAELAGLSAIINHPSTANAVLCVDPCTIHRLLEHAGKRRSGDVTVAMVGPTVLLALHAGALGAGPAVGRMPEPLAPR